MKILDTNNICDAIQLSQMPGATEAIRDIEMAVTKAAQKLAAYLNIESGPADYQAGFGGLCVNFRPSHKGQACPDVIEQGDEGGEWEPETDSGELDDTLQCQSCGRDYAGDDTLKPGDACPADDCPSHWEEKGIAAPEWIST